MIDSSACVNYIEDLFKEIYYSQFDNINLAYQLIKEKINIGGSIYFFGQGHSVWVGKEAVATYDLPLKILLETNDSPKELIEKNRLCSNDLVVIVSNSGINSYIVELAITLKKLDIDIITISSFKHCLNCDSRHKSKTKLYEYGKVNIDNCCVYGDAAILDDEKYIGSFSSIANNAIIHTILQKL